MRNESREPKAREDAMPIDASEKNDSSEPQNAFATALNQAGRGQQALDEPPPTRFPGLRRAVSQLAGLSLDSQAEVNANLICALREVGERLAELSDSVEGQSRTADERVDAVRSGLEEASGRVNRIEEHLSALSGDLGNSLAGLEQSAKTMVADVAAIEDTKREQLAADLDIRLEAIQNHLAAMTQDLMADFAEMRSVIHAQGRQVDEVGGELVATTQDIEELTETRDELRESWEAADQRISTLEKRFEPLTSLDHFDFARRYRGDEKVIQERMRKYAQIFGPVERILDFGCGRGEFLLECGHLDIGAYGIDSDPDMVSHCKLNKLEALEGDGLEHLRGLPNRSLDGIFSAQVVEHLTPAQIVEFVRLAGEKLRRGASIVIETVNPATFSAMRWFYLDPTHSQPVPHEMLHYFLEEESFDVKEVLFSSPVPEDERIALTETESDDPTVRELLRISNENGRRLNDILFGPQDYAIIAER